MDGNQIGWNRSEEPIIGVAIIEDQKETREGLSFLINSALASSAGMSMLRWKPLSRESSATCRGVALVDIGLPRHQRH